MSLCSTLITTILLVAGGALVMYWPFAILMCILVVAIAGATLNRGPVEAQSRPRVSDGDMRLAQDQTEAAGSLDLFKAA